MNNSTNLWLYFVVVFGVIILPGMDMAFVMGSSVTGGRRAGLAAVGGIVAGGMCHMIIGATGLSVILKLVPTAFTAMLIVGASYIAWIGLGLIRISSLTGPTLTSGGRSMRQSFFRAMATCLMNPKAYVFMLAIFPQFVHAEHGPIWAQAATLSVITALTQLVVYGSLALVAAQAHAVLAQRPQANAWVARGVGLVLIVAAAFTLYGGIVAQ